MLTSLQLKNWKSFGEQSRRIDFAGLTLLVGPNASGKSNVLDGLRFLQGMALGLPYGDILRGRWEGQREVWPGIRGHVAEAARSGAKEFLIETTWKLGADLGGALSADLVGRPHPRHLVRVGLDDTDVVAEEEGVFDGSWAPKGAGYLIHSHAAALRDAAGRLGGSLRVALRASGKGNSPTATISAHRSLLTQIEGGSRVHEDVPRCIGLVREALRTASFLDIQPARMRDYRPENGSVLGTSGENVSAVLHALSREPDRLQAVVDWLGELCAPELERVDFDRTQLREVMMFLVERGGRQISARSMSDGTLRFLGHVVALLTCPEDTLLVVEEPDVGLHPSRIRVLAELLQNAPARRRVQVIATTHSPILLAHLSAASLGNVVAFGRDPESGLTVTSRLRDLPHFETLRDSDRLAELVSTGWIEREL